MSHPLASPGPRPRTWAVESFCSALHTVRADCHHHGVASIQHRVEGDQFGISHELLILDVVPLLSGKTIPPTNPPHTYIQLSRSGDQLHVPFHAMWGPAADKVSVVGRMEPQVGNQAAPAHQKSSVNFPGWLLSALSWSTDLPRLVDVFEVIRLASLLYPRFNVFRRRRRWFPRTIYGVLRDAYVGYHEVVYNTWWVPCAFLMPTPPSALLSYCRDKKDWDFRATMGRIHGSALSDNDTGNN